jgi:VanZ family protein
MMEESQSKIIWHKRLWRFVPLILWVCVIFYSSTGNASMAKTSRFLRPLLELVFSSEDTIYLANVIIRKIAHLAYYATLAGFASFAFIGSPSNWIRKNWFWTSFGVVLIVASIDELNQSFNPTRVGSLTDVLLDCIGGLTILLIVKFFSSFAENDH